MTMTPRVVSLFLALAAVLTPAVAVAQSPVVVEFYHVDAVGSVRAVTNATGGLVRRHDYFPFGEENEVPGSDSLRFAGKARDGETALDYFSARYYAARTGRFTTVDPGHVGGNTFDPQSWNAYAYARNNPLRFVDPTGTEYLICGYGGGCSSVSDQYFRQLERNPGAGIYLSNGYVYAVGSNQAQGFYRQTSVDPTFNSIFRTAGDRAAPGVNAAIALGTAQVLIAGAAAIPFAAAGSESLWLGTVREFGHIVGWGTGQGTAALTRQLAQTLTKDSVNQMIRRGVTRSAVEQQLAVYQQALAKGGAKLNNTQLLPRIQLLKRILSLWP